MRTVVRPRDHSDVNHHDVVKQFIVTYHECTAEVWRMRNEKCAIQPLFMAELPKFSRLVRNLGQGTRMWRQI